MAGVFRELSAAADTDIGAAICNDGRRRTHTADRQLRAVCQPPCAVRILLYPHTVEIAALGIKVEGVCGFIVADGASDVARKSLSWNPAACRSSAQQQDIGLSCIAAFAIICTNKHIVPAYICTGFNRSRPSAAATSGPSLPFASPGSSSVREMQTKLAFFYLRCSRSLYRHTTVRYGDRAIWRVRRADLCKAREIPTYLR